MPLGIRIKIGNEEKDLDDIFLKITDYNANSSNYQAGEAVELTQNTGIKYIDENDDKKDLIDRYIGYDSDGYIAANFEADPNRIDASNLDAITDICGNNLVNLFYQLGTKKKAPPVSTFVKRSFILFDDEHEEKHNFKVDIALNATVKTNIDGSNYFFSVLNNDGVYEWFCSINISTEYYSYNNSITDKVKNFEINTGSASGWNKFIIKKVTNSVALLSTNLANIEYTIV